MVTVSLGSVVSGISKASGGRLSRRLTLTVADAMFARDWWEETERALGMGSLSPVIPSCAIPGPGALQRPDVVPGPVSPFCNGLGPYQAPCSPIAPRSQ